ncbi:MAG: hypothetical protein ACI9G1_002927 [Pirellulaceae bacterium]|jgi:hypothetical protein
MTFARTIMMTVAATIAIASGSVNAASYEHIDELALKVQEGAREMYNEIGTHYRHTPEYSHLRSDAAKLYHSAAHAHTVAHSHGSLRHLESDLSKLDQAFHHMEETLERVEHNARFGEGHTHGDTRHVRGLMRAVESNLHHLRDDIREMTRRHYGSHDIHGIPRNAVPGHGVHNVYRTTQYGSSSRNGGSYGQGRTGISYSGNGFNIRVGR